jgi:hypothetical protein
MSKSVVQVLVTVGVRVATSERETAAAANLEKAAGIMARQPAALQSRHPQTLVKSCARRTQPRWSRCRWAYWRLAPTRLRRF